MIIMPQDEVSVNPIFKSFGTFSLTTDNRKQRIKYASRLFSRRLVVSSEVRNLEETPQQKPYQGRGECLFIFQVYHKCPAICLQGHLVLHIPFMYVYIFFCRSECFCWGVSAARDTAKKTLTSVNENQNQNRKLNSPIYAYFSVDINFQEVVLYKTE